MFAGERIEKNDWIIEYVGEVISTIEKEERDKYYDQLKINYVLQIKKITVNATGMSNDGRYANHSCAPNTELKEFVDADGYPRLLFRAIKVIKLNEEITWYYNEVVDKKSELIKCLCTLDCPNTLDRLKTKEEIATRQAHETMLALQQKEAAEKEALDAERNKTRSDIIKQNQVVIGLFISHNRFRLCAFLR